MASEKLPGAERASNQEKSFSEAMEKIRSRTDLTAKGLAAVGTAAIGAVGYAEFADLYPFHGPDSARVALFGGLLAMIVAVVYAVYRFNGATRSIVTAADAEETIRLNRLGPLNHFSRDEEQTVRDAYRGMAELNGVESLAAYQVKAHRLERLAEDTPDKDTASELRAQAGQIQAEIGATQARVGALILRGRASNALFGVKTLLPVLLFAAGWYAVALGADAIESKRTGEVEVAKSCAELNKAGPLGSLPSACEVSPERKAEEAKEEAEKEQTATIESVESAATSVLAARGECRQAARKAGQPLADCASLGRALDLLTAEGPP